jgi:hypothetical protein
LARFAQPAGVTFASPEKNVTTLTPLDLFTIGIGPSSSHTVGPMRAAARFLSGLRESHTLADTSRVQISLFGSLGATGVGHGTTNALVSGLGGASPERCDPLVVSTAYDRAVATGSLQLGERDIAFAEGDIALRPLTRLPQHSNAMQFEAFDANGNVLLSRIYFSVGGGFVESEDDFGADAPVTDATLPYDFASGDGDPKDAQQGRFDPLFGARRFDLGVTGLFGPLARANLNSPGVRLDVRGGTLVEAHVLYRLAWLASGTDTWVAAGIRDASGASGDFVGQLVDGRLRLHLQPRVVMLELGAAALARGRFATDAKGGRAEPSL